MDIRYLYKDQVWDAEETVYWFNLDGLYDSIWFFGGQTYGIVESGSDVRVVDENYDDVRDSLASIIKKICAITSKMRQ